jgi:hypothetical protein
VFVPDEDGVDNAATYDDDYYLHTCHNFGSNKINIFESTDHQTVTAMLA